MSTDPRVETIRLLTSIDQKLGALLAVMSPPAPSGDPVVKAKDPRDWTHDSMKGRKFSECPPEYLDMLAARYDYFVTKAEEAKSAATDVDELQKAEKDAKYAKLDGDRARGWAMKLRAGWTPPAPAKMDEGGF